LEAALVRRSLKPKEVLDMRLLAAFLTVFVCLSLLVQLRETAGCFAIAAVMLLAIDLGIRRHVGTVTGIWLQKVPLFRYLNPFL
jgi:hypothetical protein